MLSKFARQQIKIIKKDKKQQNPQEIEFSQLFCCCKQIRIIDKLRPCYTFISQLYIDHNQLKTLNGIQQFQNLQIVSLNFNFINSLEEIKKIRNKFFLKQISFIGNPIDSNPQCNYQSLKLKVFHNLLSLNSLDIDKRRYNIKLNQNNKGSYLKTKTYTQQDWTERKGGSFICQNFDSSLKTKRQIKDSQYSLRYLSFSKKKKNRFDQKSTTINHYGNQSAQFYPINKSFSNQSFRQGFEQQKRQQNKVNQFSLNQGYTENWENIQDNSDQNQFNVSRQLDFSDKYRKQDVIENVDMRFKCLALNLIQQQKFQIAQAYSEKLLKQKFFNELKQKTKKIKQNRQVNLKAKALSAIKIFTTLQEII